MGKGCFRYEFYLFLMCGLSGFGLDVWVGLVVDNSVDKMDGLGISCERLIGVGMANGEGL